MAFDSVNKELVEDCIRRIIEGDSLALEKRWRRAGFSA